MSDPARDVMTETTARAALSDAIRYWELRRILYNAVLLRLRWILLLIGVAFAAVVASFFSRGLLVHS